MTTSSAQQLPQSVQEPQPIPGLLIRDTGSWSRCIVASWMKRIGSSQPSTMTLGPGPGPTEPGSRRSNGWGSSCSHHPGLLKAPGSCPPAPAPERFTLESTPWMGPAVCSLLGHPTPQNACNKVILRALVWLAPTGPEPPARAPPSGLWRRQPGSPAPWAVRPLSPAAAGGGVCVEGAGPAGGLAPPSPTPPPPRGPVGSACLGHMSRPPASPGPAPRRPRRPRRPPPPPPAARPPGSSGRRRRCAALRCLRPGLGRGPRRSRPPRPAPARRSRARAMGLWLPPPPAPPG
ncbi:dnaJ homolog subfamily C member 4 isoform X3 [Phocoena sinus]|uniref:dnaJ homolog subfamily C member 4 isoform X3 n=1 Tax=Phocoena sinus TaxID=42100 RepID=UPI0013C46723|nr:dnaJ homolog subfamily C member 4 isoform X3 [Phocoena sinus]